MPMKRSSPGNIFSLCFLLSAGCSTFSGLEAAREDANTAAASDETATFGARTDVDSAGDIGTPGEETAGGGATPAEDGGAAPATVAPTTSGSLCATAASDPSAAATVSGYLDEMPYGAPKGTLRAQVIDTVIRACDAFAPSGAGWKRNYCWAHLTSEILKESTFNTAASVTDAYATRAIGSQTANDPTMGLMQIRFSSVVHDFVASGPMDRLACIGCTLPASLTSHVSEAGSSSFWAVSGPTTHRALVESVSCNIGFGAWYVYLNATGNGSSSKPTYVADYCAGRGTSANLVTGLRTFLEGPSAIYGSNVAANSYVNAIKTNFDSMVGAVSGTHPFLLPLTPKTSTFCR